MTEIVRTNGQHPHFIELVKLLDAELAARDGQEHAFYHQFNKIDKIEKAVVAYENGKAVACGAIKNLEAGVVEVKRMYTLPVSRRKGIASIILKALEEWAVESGCSRAVLETGKRQPEAIAVYEKSGYQVIPNYGQYAGVENSVCFMKLIAQLF